MQVHVRYTLHLIRVSLEYIELFRVDARVVRVTLRVDLCFISWHLSDLIFDWHYLVKSCYIKNWILETHLYYTIFPWICLIFSLNILNDSCFRSFGNLLKMLTARYASLIFMYPMKIETDISVCHVLQLWIFPYVSYT